MGGVVGLDANREARRGLTAPLGEPPLLLRAGAVLPLLDRDVETLAPYAGEDDLVRVDDRSRRLRLLAVPRGRSSSPLPSGGRARSIEHHGSWTLRIRSRRLMTFELQASLSELRTPFRPRELLLNGKPLPNRAWSYERGAQILQASVRGKRLRLEAR